MSLSDIRSRSGVGTPSSRSILRYERAMMIFASFKRLLKMEKRCLRSYSFPFWC